MLANAMAKLKDLISCITYNGAQHTHIQINESDAAAKLKKITLVAPNDDWFSFDPDEGRKCKRIHQQCNAVVMSPLLAIDQHDYHRACDCVIVLNRGGELTLLYIDLKSGNPVGYAEQFKSTRQFMRYTLGLLEEFHQEKLEIAEERYVILHGGKSNLVNKTTTISKVKKTGKSKPDKAYKLEVANGALLYLKDLLS